MSFSLTTQQCRERSKTVTRRLGWQKLKPGDLVQQCVKCMGLKPGEQIERIQIIRIVDVRREPLARCDDADARREGFPALTGEQFIAMFCKHMGVTPETEVTRIEYCYVIGSRL